MSLMKLCSYIWRLFFHPAGGDGVILVTDLMIEDVTIKSMEIDRIRLKEDCFDDCCS